jgi:membrane protein implicated in regulation of membrane protease activity
MSWVRAAFFALPMLVLAVVEALPHHAFSPVYDEKRVITVAGIVTEFRFVNPHAMMVMDVTDEAAKVVPWVVEFAGRLNLSEFSWTADSIKAGERVTVTGNPTHTGSQRMFFRRLVRADGTELLPGNAQRLDTIDEERRRRARQRDQK